MSDTKIILDIDSPTFQQTQRALREYKQNHHKSPLFKPDICGGCGNTLQEFSKVLYFQEYFCTECVDKWTQGHK